MRWIQPGNRKTAVRPGGRSRWAALLGVLALAGVMVTACQSLPLSAGSASCTVTSPATGAHAIVATYTGNADYARPTSTPLTEVVSRTPCRTLVRCNLSGIDLSGAKLAGADLTCANLNNADLSGANLAGADLTCANLNKADLSGANLAAATLTSANLRGANAAGATLTGADLTRANLTGADLTGANLTNADLDQANLLGADITGANLTGAYLGGANVHKVTWSNTTYPDATNSDDQCSTSRGHLQAG